ncbi:MAG: hypothetical protein R2747_17445 [Pyrinomonadaceae bacterium]
MDKLFGLPEGEEVSKILSRLISRTDRLGVEVINDLAVPDHARFIGIFDDNRITLYPRVAPLFACWFTIAHLYGHMCQLLNKTPRVNRSNELVLKLGETLAPEDVQLIYDHEREAAEIGRTLIASVEPDLPDEMDRAYCRFFHADFHYLINVIETGEGGEDLFALYWKREPVPRALIEADPRPLFDFNTTGPSTEKIVVV